MDFLTIFYIIFSLHLMVSTATNKKITAVETERWEKIMT